MYCPHFQNAKLLCTCGIPQHPAFVPDFDASIDNLDAIMGQLGDGRNKRSTITTNQPGAQIKIRHALFTVRSGLRVILGDSSDLFFISRMMIQRAPRRKVCGSITVHP
jgi:hypothetical protein